MGAEEQSQREEQQQQEQQAAEEEKRRRDVQREAECPDPSTVPYNERSVKELFSEAKRRCLDLVGVREKFELIAALEKDDIDRNRNSPKADTPVTASDAAAR